MDAAHTTRPKLGQLLLAQGILTEETLADALDEARASGRRLGSVLVDRGVLSGPALANFLADQQGGIIRTEYGIATGFRKHTAPPPAPLRPESSSEASDYVVVLERDGQYALFAGAGTLPDAGVAVNVPPFPDEQFVVARHEWRRVVVLEPAPAPAQQHAAA